MRINMDWNELNELRKNLESDRTERKRNMSDKDRICQAICAFANDLSNYQKPGYIFVGIEDNGTPYSDFTITDEILRELASIRSDGNILPQPIMNVQKHSFEEKDVAVVEVFPNEMPPVRYNGVTWIRIGPRRAMATLEEERRLTEKRRMANLSFDLQPVRGSTIKDISVKLFQNEYLPYAVAPEVLEENKRTPEEQMASSRFLSGHDGCPTVVGMLMLGNNPQNWLPGSYIQFLRIEGLELTDFIKSEKMIASVLSQQLRELDELIALNIVTSIEIPPYGSEIRIHDYPVKAIQQIIRNAIMHRNYQGTNAPVRFYWYSDRIEIHSPGGLYGQVTPENFRSTTDYRNPAIAEAMKVMGFVQRFGVGIQMADKEMAKNGNPPLEFQFEPTCINVTLRRRA
ncbi:MAG: ATP-binding protein [Candidatus Desantisbacteria bacterium]